MPENKVDEVFNRWRLARAATEVPKPGADGQATIDGSNSVWNGEIDASFIEPAHYLRRETAEGHI